MMGNPKIQNSQTDWCLHDYIVYVSKSGTSEYWTCKRKENNCYFVVLGEKRRMNSPLDYGSQRAGLCLTARCTARDCCRWWRVKSRRSSLPSADTACCVFGSPMAAALATVRELAKLKRWALDKKGRQFLLMGLPARENLVFFFFLRGGCKSGREVLALVNILFIGPVQPAPTVTCTHKEVQQLRSWLPNRAIDLS